MLLQRSVPNYYMKAAEKFRRWKSLQNCGRISSRNEWEAERKDPSDRKSLRKVLAQKYCVALIRIVIQNQLTNSFLKFYVFVSMY